MDILDKLKGAADSPQQFIAASTGMSELAKLLREAHDEIASIRGTAGKAKANEGDFARIRDEAKASEKAAMDLRAKLDDKDEEIADLQDKLVKSQKEASDLTARVGKQAEEIESLTKPPAPDTSAGTNKGDGNSQQHGSANNV